jgi:hypothetical protein
VFGVPKSAAAEADAATDAAAEAGTAEAGAAEAAEAAAEAGAAETGAADAGAAALAEAPLLEQAASSEGAATSPTPASTPRTRNRLRSTTAGSWDAIGNSSSASDRRREGRSGSCRLSGFTSASASRKAASEYEPAGVRCQHRLYVVNNGFRATRFAGCLPRGSVGSHREACFHRAGVTEAMTTLHRSLRVSGPRQPAP